MMFGVSIAEGRHIGDREILQEAIALAKRIAAREGLGYDEIRITEWGDVDPDCPYSLPELIASCSLAVIAEDKEIQDLAEFASW